MSLSLVKYVLSRPPSRVRQRQALLLLHACTGRSQQRGFVGLTRFIAKVIGGARDVGKGETTISSPTPTSSFPHGEKQEQDLQQAVDTEPEQDAAKSPKWQGEGNVKENVRGSKSKIPSVRGSRTLAGSPPKRDSASRSVKRKEIRKAGRRIPRRRRPIRWVFSSPKGGSDTEAVGDAAISSRGMLGDTKPPLGSKAGRSKRNKRKVDILSIDARSLEISGLYPRLTARQAWFDDLQRLTCNSHRCPCCHTGSRESSSSIPHRSRPSCEAKW
jgi:hypothetical protein